MAEPLPFATHEVFIAARWRDGASGGVRPLGRRRCARSACATAM